MGSRAVGGKCSVVQAIVANTRDPTFNLTAVFCQTIIMIRGNPQF